MQLKSKIALAGAGLLALGGLAAAGVALAGSGATAAPTHSVRVVNASQVTPQAPAANAPAAPPAHAVVSSPAGAPASPAAAPAAGPASAPADTDDVAAGGKEVPESPTASEASDATDATETATAEIDTPGSHQDPPGAETESGPEQ